MIPLSHVILHLGLCAPIERLPDTASFTARVRLINRVGQVPFQRTFRVERGDENVAIVEFDAPWGIYHLTIDVPKYACSADDYIAFRPNDSRSIPETLAVGPSGAQVPILLDGAAPPSFFYAKPTFVVFNAATTTCNKPIGAPLPLDLAVQEESDAYYASLFPQPPTPPNVTPLLALRLQTPTHQYHYIHLPITLAWSRWPSSVELDVTQAMIEGIAEMPTGTLLCPHLWETSTHT